MRWIKKRSATVSMASTSSIFVQSLGKIVHRASAVGAEHGVCMFVFCKIFVTLRGRHATLFQEGLLFQVHYTVLIVVARWHHKFREIAVKNFEKSKNRRKRLSTRLRTDS